jgi:LysR family nitrogen assimilation transcriptional regulator
MPLRPEIDAGLLVATPVVNPPLERILVLCGSAHIPLSSASQAVASLSVALVQRLCTEGHWPGGTLLSGEVALAPT